MIRYFLLYLCGLLPSKSRKSSSKRCVKPTNHEELHIRLEQARLIRVHQLWLFALVAVALFPSPAFGIAAVLFTTFLSFSVLDESG